MTRYLVIAFMLICSVAYACDYCIDHPGEKEKRYKCQHTPSTPGVEILCPDCSVVVKNSDGTISIKRKENK